MDLTDSEIVILVVATVFIIILFRKQLIKWQREQELRARFIKIAARHNLQPFKIDFFSDKLLALDLAKKVLVYLDYFALTKSATVELDDLKESKLTVRNLVVRLDLKFHNPCKERISIIFFQRFVDSDFMRPILTARARKWNELLADSLKGSREFEYGISG